MKFSSIFTRLKGMPSVALLALACSAFGGVSSAAPFTWSGNGGDTLWSSGANWVGGTVTTGSTLVFSGQNRTTNVNNLTLTTGTINFANTGSTSTGFVLSGSNLNMGTGRITTAQLAGSGTVQEEVNLNVAMGGALTLTATGGSGKAHNLLISGNFINGTGTNNNNITVANGAGAQVILSGNNTNVGSYTVSLGGILTALGTTALNHQTVALAGTINANGAELKVGPLSGAGLLTSSEAGLHDVNVNLTGASSFSGQITDGSGTLSLTKNGVGAISLGGASTYTGDTKINAGTLTIGSAGSISSASVVEINGTSVVNDNRSGAITFNNTLNGSGTAGTLNFATDSTVGIGSSGNFAGLINTGSSFATFSGNLGSAAVNVGLSGSLYGTGTVGNVNVAGDAAIISAATNGTVGKLSVGDLIFNTTDDAKSVTTRFDIVGSGTAAPLYAGIAGTDYDTIVGTGTIDYGAKGSNLVFDFTGSTSDVYKSWAQFKLLDFAGAANVDKLTADQFTTVGGAYDSLTFTDAGSGIFVADAGNGQTVEFYAGTGVLMIVPEPSSIILAGLGIGLAGFRTWRNRRLKAILNRAGSKA